jgi:YD repeat-containing protein
MYCEHCGVENDNDAKFCVSCGKTMDSILQNDDLKTENNSSEKTKVIPIIIIVVSLCVVAIIAIAILANNSTGGNNKISSSDKKNDQTAVLNLLDRETTPLNYGLFQNSFTNGKEYLKTMYAFKSNPEEFSYDENYIDAYEANYTMKYEFLYENGDANLTVQAQEFSRDSSDEPADFEHSYYFGRDYENKNRLQAYNSYWIDSQNEEHDDDYWYYSYDENGNLTEMSDATGDDNYYYYDGYGVLSEKYYDDDTYSFTYEKDENGNISSVSRYIGETLKRRYEYEYDFDGNIVKETFYYYDSDKGEMLLSVSSFNYDEHGNVTTETKEKYSEFSGEYEDTETTSYYYNENYNIVKKTITDKYSTYYLIYEYTDSPTPYEVLYQ